MCQCCQLYSSHPSEGPQNSLPRPWRPGPPRRIQPRGLERLNAFKLIKQVRFPKVNLQENPQSPGVEPLVVICVCYRACSKAEVHFWSSHITHVHINLRGQW